MKNILVVDTAAEVGGALTILDSFYQAVKKENCGYRWFFLVSKPDLKNTENIIVLKYAWTKKSKIHRLFFDFFIIPKLIKRLDIDIVLSLQNNAVFTYKPQIVYIHQSIPFAEYKFKFNKDRTLWFIQNILKISICSSIKRANKVVVQSNWMKRACLENTGINADKIIVLPPEVNLEGIRKFQYANKNINRFFYPAIAKEYKNHMVIVKACEVLQKAGISDYEVEFTFEAEQNDYAKTLSQIVSEKHLPIHFVGRLNLEEMRQRYKSSVLIFSSFLETVGLPLKEAGRAGDIIISADCPYAHEALDNYKNVYYFKHDDDVKLASYMMKCIDHSIGYEDVEWVQTEERSWRVLFDELYNICED